LFFSGRAVDLRGNHSTPSETHMVTIPTFLVWSPGGVNVAGSPSTYTVTWPSVSSSCASKPLAGHAACTSNGGCNCVVPGHHEAATCTTASCNAINVSVTASAGMSSLTRMGSAVTHFSDVSFIFSKVYLSGHSPCRDCHNSGFPPTFTAGDVG